MLLIILQHLKAQDLPNVAPPSPTTLAMQKYGDYPVSHYTGIPDIKVPIYTIKEGDITVPIYLSFHASGLNIDEKEGNIGPGWTLHTGGFVSRTIKGVPDETYGGIHIPEWSKNHPWNTNANYQYQYQSMYEDYINSYYRDHELDVFNYNIPGYSGQFMPYAHFVNDPDATTPYHAFKLKEDNLLIRSPQSMVDENGIIYSFGGSGQEEFQDFVIGGSPYEYQATSTWHLAEIYSARHPGRGVSYEYQEGRQYGLETSWTWNLDDYYYDESYFSMSDVLPYSHKNQQTQLSQRYNRHYTLFPQRITFSSGYLLFFLNSSKYLERIEIYDQEDQLLRKVELVGYNVAGRNREFRMINSVVFKDANSTEQERYGFTYYNGGQSAMGGKDLWGFYNGRPFLGDYIVPIRNLMTMWFENGYGASTPAYFPDLNYRDVNAEAAKTFMLQRMTYPTGGYTEFNYEGNSISNYKTIGGLRIKNIANFDRNGQLVGNKSYEYSSFGAELDVSPELFLQHSAVVVASGSRGEFSRRSTITETAPVTIFPKGAPIGYYRVKETEVDRSTTYYYDDNPAYVYEELSAQSNSFPGDGYERHRLFAHHYKPWNFGNLTSKEVISPNYRKIEYYNYEPFLKDTVHDVVMNQSVFVIDLGGNSPAYWHQNYNSIYNFANRYHYSGGNRLKSIYSSEINNDGTSLDNIRHYEYDNLSYPLAATRIRESKSTGDSTATYQKYAFDYNTSPYSIMVSKNLVTTPIEEKKYSVPDGKFLSAVKTDWKHWGAIAESDWWNNLVAPEAVSTKIDMESNPYDPRVRYHSYTNYGNIGSVSKENGPKVSYQWEHEGLHPVAEVKNAAENEFYAATFEDESGFDANLVKDGSHARTGEYSGLIFNPGNPEKVSHSGTWLDVSLNSAKYFHYSGWIYSNGPQAEILLFMKRTGETGYYSYVDAVQTTEINKWVYVEKKFLVPSDVTKLSLRVDNNSTGSVWFDDLRLHPSDASMTTYTYKIPLGVTSVTDDRNETVYFEYDAYQRLKNVQNQDRTIIKKNEYHYKP